MIKVEVKDQDVLSLLSRLSAGMKDMGPAMANVAQALASESERQFATQSGAFGGWPTLSDTTISLRSKRGTWPGRILDVSAGGLASSVQTSYGPNFASIGSNKPYAAMQMFGGTTSAKSMIPGKKIPARPYLPFNPETGQLTPQAKITVLEVLQMHIDRLTK